MNEKKIRVGIVGCGCISEIYIKNISQLFKNVEVTAVCDQVLEKAKAKADAYNIPNVLSLDELVACEQVDIVVNLTTPQNHFPVLKKAIEAGKHAYTEKPFTLTYKDAKELLDLAEKNHVMVGCAPDTFLGAGYQTARKVVDDGLIGKPVSAMTFDVCHGHENWHMDPEFFYQNGGGPVFDRGPYNLTALIMLLGPVKSVTGMASKAFDKRMITSEKKYGKMIDVEIPTHVASLLEFQNGTICTFTMSFDVWNSNLPKMELHGTTGSLSLPDPNTFGGEVQLSSYFCKEFKTIPYSHIYSENSRGVGLSEMAQSLLDGTTSRCDAKIGAHVTEIMQAMHESAQTGKTISLESTCSRPDGLPLGLIKGFVK